MMEEFRKRLRGCIQKLSLSIVMKEVQVFSRLLYRSKNQHRRDKSYQMLVRVSKDLKRYHTAALHNQLKALLKLCSDHVSRAVKTETRELASRLTECAVFTAKLLSFIEQTFSEVHQRLTMSLFIPFNLLMVASLSRMWFCLRYHLLAISETYSVVRSSLYENVELPHSIADHLGRMYQDYLMKPTTGEEKKAGREGLSAGREGLSTGREGLSAKEMVPPASELIIRDMGVPVALNEEQLAKRQQDFVYPPKLSSAKLNHSATSLERGIISPCEMDGACDESGSRPWKRRGGKGHRTKRANVLLVLVKNGGKILKLRARSKRLISRLGRGRLAHTVVAKGIRIGGKLPWGLVHWYSLQLHATTPLPHLRKRVHLHERNMLRQRGVRGLDTSEQDCLMATEPRSVQALQRKFTLEMEEAETGRSEEANDGVQTEAVDAQTTTLSNAQLGSGTDGTVTSHKIPPTSPCINHDDIEEIFSMLGELQ